MVIFRLKSITDDNANFDKNFINCIKCGSLK